ncbi:MAG: hypothetical protein WC390_08575 [Sulfurimonas sp.]|jgi:hypothetical protein
MPQETVEQVARKVVADIADETAFVLAADWVNERYREYIRRCKPRHLMQVGELNLPAYVTGGAATITRGSNTITGDATAQALWNHDLAGWYIRLRTVWYEIAYFNAFDSSIILKSNFGELDVSAGTYYIIKKFHSLPTDVKSIGTLLYPRRMITLENIHRDALDSLAPQRTMIGGMLQFWAEQGVDSETGARRIEIYPPAKEYEMLIYTYWQDPPYLDLETSIPLFVDPYVLKEGALVNAFRYKAAKAADAGHADIAQFYANWHERQETKWTAKMRSMAIAERMTDDQSIILKWNQSRTALGKGDITNARQEILSSWNPLTQEW